jgi:hypothetical protein
MKINIKKYTPIIVLSALIVILCILVIPLSYCYTLPEMEYHFGGPEYPKAKCLQDYHENSVRKNLQETTAKLPDLDSNIINEIIFKLTTISANIEKMPENEEEVCKIIKNICGYECEHVKKEYEWSENRTYWLGSIKEQPLSEMVCLTDEWKGYGFRIENNTILCRWFCGMFE